jgi:Xaa-Pro aminopeptidase
MSEISHIPSRGEIDRRYRNIRAAAADAGLDAVLVCGSEYTGFEGAVTYTCGFRILHRYAYVLIPLDDDPTCVFPQEAAWVGDHSETFVDDRVFVETPGAWLRDRLRQRGLRRVGVSGMDFAMPVRDYQALAEGDAELVRFDEQFDRARAVKSEEELRSVRESMAINEAGFWAVLEAYEPGRTEAELMGEAERAFAARGTTRLTMDMVLSGPHGAMPPEMRHPDPRRPIEATDLLLYGLEVAGPGGHWVEFSRPICGGPLAGDTQTLLEAYREYHEAARAALRDGASAQEAHRAVARPFTERGYRLGHVTGHSIGMTMIELPRVGEGMDVRLERNMVLSMHPHAYNAERTACLYMQDTWLVGADDGEPLSQVPVQVFDGSEANVGSVA